MIDIWKEFLDELACAYKYEKTICIFLICLILIICVTATASNLFLGAFEIFLFFFIAPYIVHILNEYC